MSADRCVEIEPALVHQHAQICGPTYTAGECAADCQKVCDGLMQVLRQRGVTFLLNTTVQKLVRSGQINTAARTPQGDIEAAHYILALGSASARLARWLSIRLPIYPLKGYSITVDVNLEKYVAPKVSVTDSARKVVFARISSRLRVAGMADLSGYDRQISERQIASLKASTRRVFPGSSAFSELNPWAGLRPATPSGLPLIGRHAAGPRNLLLNTGHGALGFTLAFGSARRIISLLEQDALNMA